MRSVKLDRMRQLLNRLGRPDQGLKIVHVAGTKGKGSTSTMIAGMLSAAGYRTGLFTSPHLECIEERFAIDGAACSAIDFVSLVEKIEPAVRELDQLSASDAGLGYGPTYFEITTAMSLLHFAHVGVDAAVLEVGLGGRLDATNVCQPLVSVITNISLDHTSLLGDTTASIAEEKAGIIKPGIPVVSGVSEPSARAVIARRAVKQGCYLLEVDRDFGAFASSSVARHAGSPIQAITFWQRRAGGEQRETDLPLALLGTHQIANAATALATVELLRADGWQVHPSAIRDALRNVRLPARVECLANAPIVIVDAAHNVASIEALVATLDESFSPQRRVLILSVAQDKDADGMVRSLLSYFDEIVVTELPDNPRVLSAQELAAIVRVASEQQETAQVAPSVRVEPDPQRAFADALASAAEDDLVCITGSFFLAAQLRGDALRTLGQR